MAQQIRYDTEYGSFLFIVWRPLKPNETETEELKIWKMGEIGWGVIIVYANVKVIRAQQGYVKKIFLAYFKLFKNKDGKGMGIC